MDSDAELVRRVRQRDVEAFGMLCRRYEKTTLASALAQTGDIHIAEDVVQETLLRAYQRIATLRDDAKFGPWLLRIAHRQVVEAVRARRLPVEVPLHDHSQRYGRDGGIESWIDNQHLLSLVARLPERERILIGLRYFDGHSMSQIAGITARPLGTATKQLSRAIARLRSWCEKESP